MTKKNMIYGSVLFVMLVLLWLISTNKLPEYLTRNKKVITIGVFSDSYWDVQNGHAYQILDDAISVFEKEHPGIQVQYVSGIMKDDYSEWLGEQLLAGTAPDLFFVLEKDFSSLAQIGVLKDLNKLGEKDEAFDPDVFYKSAFSSGEYRDSLYALPYECAPKLMFVNRTILNQENIPMPREDWTWDDFYEICRKVTKDTQSQGMLDQFGVVGYTWRDAFYENDVHLFNEEGTKCYFNSENVADTMYFLEKLNSLSNGYRITTKDFDNGKVAFMPMSFSEYRAYRSYPLSIKKYSGFEWECIEMPSGPRGENLSELETLMIGMNARTSQEKLAWEFLKMLTTDERIQSELFDYSEGVSVVKSVTESDETDFVLSQDAGETVTMSIEVLSRVLENAVVPSRFRDFDQALEQVDLAVQSILGGDKNINMELIVRNREINKYLQELRMYRT